MIRKDFESCTIVRSWFPHENVWSSSIKVTEKNKRKERTRNEANGRKRRVNLNLYDFRKVVYIFTLCLIFVGWMQIIFLPSLLASSELLFCFWLFRRKKRFWLNHELAVAFPSFIYFSPEIIFYSISWILISLCTRKLRHYP